MENWPIYLKKLTLDHMEYDQPCHQLRKIQNHGHKNEDSYMCISPAVSLLRGARVKSDAEAGSAKTKPR